MKRFKTFIHEQHLSQTETTSSPEFLERKQRKDDKIMAKIEKPIKEVDKEAKRAAEKMEDVVD
jgi:hypothetical protein